MNIYYTYEDDNKISLIFSPEIIEDQILCLHGGIGANVKKLSDIESVRTNAALMNYFAFFELDEPYINNRKYTITFKNYEPISFIYNDMNISNNVTIII